jgi:3-(3-hydroxy-phenyl)propionate hydroxylase
LVAERWRSGRVLIAGDAAHQTPPFLGQGMCTGIRDAANLAWKLARVIKHGAPEALLDTYERERRPHAIKVINAAIRIGKVICELDPQKAAERDRLLRANSSKMREGLSFALPRLDVGPLVLKGGGGLSVQTNNGESRSDDIVGSRFLVLCRTREALGRSADWWADEVDAHVAAVGDFDDPPLNRWFDRQGADVVVVRPDRYVLGSGENLDRITDSVCGLLADAGRAGREASEAQAL